MEIKEMEFFPGCFSEYMKLDGSHLEDEFSMNLEVLLDIILDEQTSESVGESSRAWDDWVTQVGSQAEASKYINALKKTTQVLIKPSGHSQ
jgi:hypothetical protein